MLDMLKIGKLAFPGLVVRQQEIDIICKGILKACFIETVNQYVSGKGKSSLLDDLWNELKVFDIVTIEKDRRFGIRPAVSVAITAPSDNKYMELVDMNNEGREGAPVKTINAAIKINFQSRVLVSRH